MEISLRGKTALVTGASRGIGAAIAKSFAEAGAQVMLCSRKEESLRAVAEQIDGETDGRYRQRYRLHRRPAHPFQNT